MLRKIADKYIGPIIAWLVGWACSGVDLEIHDVSTGETKKIRGW